jgi:hypothetical protein
MKSVHERLAAQSTHPLRVQTTHEAEGPPAHGEVLPPKKSATIDTGTISKSSGILKEYSK